MVCCSCPGSLESLESLESTCVGMFAQSLCRSCPFGKTSVSVCWCKAAPQLRIELSQPMFCSAKHCRAPLFKACRPVKRWCSGTGHCLFLTYTSSGTVSSVENFNTALQKTALPTRLQHLKMGDPKDECSEIYISSLMSIHHRSIAKSTTFH